MHWPSAWKDPALLERIRGTSIDTLLVAAELGAIRERAQRDGLRVVDPEKPPAGVTILKGEWPGVRVPGGSGSSVSAGPTGVPWVDSNGWSIRLARTLHADTAVWVDAPPPENRRVTAESYALAIADSGAYGGRWIIRLDGNLAAGIVSGQADAVKTWNRIGAAAGYFGKHAQWAGYVPIGIAGVVSDFTGKNEFFSRESLNLLARAGMHYVILPKNSQANASWSGLRALIYADVEPAAPALRKQMLAFVERGGTLIAAPSWGDPAGTPGATDRNGRFTWRKLGQGRVALAAGQPDDPYVWANDAAVLVSHRHDLVRFWNGGATGSFCTLAPDRRKSAVHLMFYSDRGPDSATVRVAGRYSRVTASTIESPDLTGVSFEGGRDAAEIRLPQVPQYVTLELDLKE